MNKEFHYIYQYLERERISIDVNEFETQIQGHPEYPSLLSIIDTLSFFNIENGAFQVDLSQIEFLPNRFLTILQDESMDSQYYLIERKKGYYFCYRGNNKIKISQKILQSRWHGRIILIEKPNTKSEIEQKRNNSLKKMFMAVKGLRSGELERNLNTSNYNAFKNTVLSFNVLKNDLLQSFSIQLGNWNASLKIMIIINPFSNHCKESYFIMEKILQKYFDKVCFDIRFNFNNSDYSNKNSKKIHQCLIAVYQDFGQETFMKVLSNWFKLKDEMKLCATQISQANESKINEILNAQFNSNSDNNIIFTPTFVINKYIFPKQYDLRELSHFISEMSEDVELQ